MMRRPFQLGIAFAGLVLAAGPTARAETETGAIEGRVANSTGLDPGHVVVYLAGDLPRPMAPALEIRQKNLRFVPSFVALPAGASVSFQNDEEEGISHNVFSRAPNWNVDLGLFGSGMVRTSEFPAAGRVRIACSIHQNMSMEVFVTPNPFFTVVEEGRFRIDGVPRGTHIVKVWAANVRVAAAPATIEVAPGATTVLDVTLAERGRSP